MLMLRPANVTLIFIVPYITQSVTHVGPPVLNNVTHQVIQWGGERTIDCPYQPAGSYRDGISVRWRLLRGSEATIQRIKNNTAYSVNPTTYSLTISNFTPLLYGDYDCRLTYNIEDVYDPTINVEYIACTPDHDVPVSIATGDSLGIDTISTWY